jgi:MarR family transcriptional regulator, temperature-dependent positive regulator of motility
MKQESNKTKTQTKIKEPWASMDLYDQPGHLLRRAHQIAMGVYADKVGQEVSPREYAILKMIHETPGIDQVSLAGLISVDTSSTALSAAKLADRGLIKRSPSNTDKRQLSLTLTRKGLTWLNKTAQGVQSMKDQLMSSLEPKEQELLMELLKKFVHINNAESRAPFFLTQK